MSTPPGHRPVSVSVAVSALPVAAAVVDRSGLVLEANDRFVALAGPGVVGTPADELVAAGDQGPVRGLLSAPDPGRRANVTFTATSGPLVELSVVPVEGDDGSRSVVFAVVVDREAELGDQAERAHDLLGQGVVIGDGRRVLHVSEAAAAIFGRPAEELLELGTLFSLFDPAEQSRLRAIIDSHMADGRPVPEHFETVVTQPGGREIPVDLWVKATVSGERVRTYTLIADARQRRPAQLRLAHRAMHDGLTGLANRYKLMDRLDLLLSAMARRPIPSLLCFIDLDGFKAVNDQFGHRVGDEVLKTIATRLSGGLRSCDTVARFGGDEFVVLCSEVDAHLSGAAMADRLAELIEAPIVGDGWTARIGASIGTLAFADSSLGADTLIAHADMAMYDEKGLRRMSGASRRASRDEPWP